MRNRLVLVLIISFIPCLFSCRTYRPLVSNTAPAQSVSDYINLYKDIAVSEMQRTGIPASITLAQGIIESDCGRSSLAREAHNHFGIKCHDDWSGQSIRYDDNKRNECFRKYRKAEESFYDHSDFLKSGSRYSFLFDLKSNDYKSWAHGLKKAGYATNPDYANMLIRTIEMNNLSEFDSGMNISANQPAQDSLKHQARVSQSDSSKKVIQVPSRNVAVTATVPRILENNRIKYIVVKDGETREKIEDEFQLLRWELPKYNDINKDFIPVAGQILYLQPKRDQAEPGKEFYTTIDGDTMYRISQQYGIKLKKLYEMNRMAESVELGPGQKIWLRNIKPVE